MRGRLVVVFLTAVVTAAVALFAGCCRNSGTAYTLYRNGVSIPPNDLSGIRIHVATFDADGGEDYNRENCQIAQELFQAQSGVTVRYWCEKGPFRK